ncbi:hypothetical protein FNV43_RR23849 [Rhamnella rubrinervis]|uniref:RRM domain-containing protein n=1 Tax=Rhamnella rubrinervis TaxID=2594499 RepID=A0A8K0GKN0_9ROSA|nr:hypothetical protein FNV43_RR23849 [Rhamnella rubrinervis]
MGGISGTQFGDTTYTKIFVGGLAWETQRETMRRYFEQFGEILEAVVIIDRNTGRSKGYGFVTFKDPNSAMRACHNPYPVIDGRRANCNLAAFGAQKNHPTIPLQRGMEKFRPSSRTIAQVPFNAPSHLYQHIPEYAFPYSAYGYPCYPHDNNTVNYYNAYGGQQYPSYYAIGSPGVYFGCYPVSTLHVQTSPTTKSIESSLGSLTITATSSASPPNSATATGTIAAAEASGVVSKQSPSA